VISLSIACAVGCAVLVLAEWRQLAALRVVAKLVASLAFFAAGLVADPDRHWMIAGLALGVVGDFALLGRSKRAFHAGLAAFLLGHLAYIAGMAALAPPRSWIAWPAVVPIGAGVLALRWLWPHLGSLRVAVIAYVLAIVVMVIAALAVHEQTLALGAVLFFASDLAVARDKFVSSSVANRAWGLPAYYTAQLLIAWSLA